MPRVEIDGLTINYDVQGEGDPVLLIPYTGADHACWAFQLPAYTEHFSCVAIDLPGSGESGQPAGPYTTDGYADQVAAFLAGIGIERVHVAGVSLGAAVGIHLAARHPDRVRSLSLHSGWHTSDAYLKSVVEQWRTMASALPTVADVMIQGIFPWCFTPEMYNDRHRIRRRARGLREKSPRAASGRVPSPTRRGRRPRRERGARGDPCPDPDYFRCSRSRLLDALRRAAAQRHRRQRTGDLRASLARGAARRPRDLQPCDARIPAASTLMTCAVGAIETASACRAVRTDRHCRSQRQAPGVVGFARPVGRTQRCADPQVSRTAPPDAGD